MSQYQSLAAMHQAIRECRVCVNSPVGKLLPHEPNPVVVPSTTARIAICGQAPGARVHKSGRPFTDPSGDRLRQWMGVTEDEFYDPDKIAIIPMGFCFPGHDAKGGDLPPRKECKSLWHDQLFAAMPQIELVLVIGLYAQSYHLGKRVRRNLTETVSDWRSYLSPNATAPCPGAMVIPTPHPSWRNNHWLRKNLFFEADLLPFLQAEVTKLL